QPRLRPRDLRGAREGARPEGLPRLRRRRPTGVAGERGPAGPPSHDRSEGPPRGSRPAAAACGERGPVSDVRGGLARERDPLRVVRLRVRPRTRPGRDRGATRADHGRPRESRGGRRLPRDAGRRPERDLAGLRRRDARRTAARSSREATILNTQVSCRNRMRGPYSDYAAPPIYVTREPTGPRPGVRFSRQELFQLGVAILALSAALTIANAMALRGLYPAS